MKRLSLIAAVGAAVSPLLLVPATGSLAATSARSASGASTASGALAASVTYHGTAGLRGPADPGGQRVELPDRYSRSSTIRGRTCSPRWPPSGQRRRPGGGAAAAPSASANATVSAVERPGAVPGSVPPPPRG